VVAGTVNETAGGAPARHACTHLVQQLLRIFAGLLVLAHVAYVLQENGRRRASKIIDNDNAREGGRPRPMSAIRSLFLRKNNK